LELSMDRLHHLADASEPAPQRLGPRRLAVPLGGNVSKVEMN
jgi:hypothetical protein